MKHQVYNLIILDESGSMQSIKSTIIQGFNEVVQTVKGIEAQFPEQEHFISFVTFNGLGIKKHLDRQPVSTLPEIDEKKYQPNSQTPLYDAIGFSALELKSYLEDKKDFNVLVTILTDGEENQSKEFSGQKIKQLIDELKTSGWTFSYIGANHDVEKVAATMSITNTMSFNLNEPDMRRMFDKEKNSRFAYSQKIREKKDVKDGFYDEATTDSSKS